MQTGSSRQWAFRPSVYLSLTLNFITTEGAMGESRMQMDGRDASTPLGPYPERSGEQDCPYYMRTGLCGFGTNCRFNHPPNTNLASAPSRSNAQLPERIGQSECQYYLKTGTCKFGSLCKFHHPPDKGGEIFGRTRTRMNVLGLPLRPGEKDCDYYMRTRMCKYGSTCKFNHPQPGVGSTALSASPIFPGLGLSPISLTNPSSYLTESSWQIPQPTLQLQNSSLFSPLMLQHQQSIVPFMAWNPYHPNATRSLGGNYNLVSREHNNPLAMAPFHAYIPRLSLPPSPSSPLRGIQETSFPERPGHRECQYYMKNGDCKFGMSCRFHHPHLDTTVLSPLSSISNPVELPLRPGVSACIFYSRNGYCKFGSTCKFDHPRPQGTPPLFPSSSSQISIKELVQDSSEESKIDAQPCIPHPIPIDSVEVPCEAP